MKPFSDLISPRPWLAGGCHVTASSPLVGRLSAANPRQAVHALAGDLLLNDVNHSGISLNTRINIPACTPSPPRENKHIMFYVSNKKDIQRRLLEWAADNTANSIAIGL